MAQSSRLGPHDSRCRVLSDGGSDTSWGPHAQLNLNSRRILQLGFNQDSTIFQYTIQLELQVLFSGPGVQLEFNKAGW